MVQVQQDEESTASMIYMKNVFGMEKDKNPELQDISQLKLMYNEQCEPIWKFGQTPVSCLFNNYPSEWMVTEIESDVLTKHDFEKLRTVEPWWKLILGNKALLPLLWQMFPNHPNLLPAYYDSPKQQLAGGAFEKSGTTNWVSKPIFGREGAGIFASANFTSFDDFVRLTEENYGRDSHTNEKLGKSVYQALWDLPVAQGRVIQTSSWVIKGMPAGLAFREGVAGTFFEDASPYLVHSVRESQGKALDFELTPNQNNLRNQLYGKNCDFSIYSKYGNDMALGSKCT